MAVLTKVYLGNSIIAELDQNKTATMLTKKRKAPKDIRIYFGVPGTVEYNGVLNGVLSGKTAVLECEDKVLKTNIIIRTFLAHEDSSAVVVNIIDNILPMYTLDGQGSLVQVTYDDNYYRRMTMNAFTAKERGNFFYQIVNSEDELVQSGYSLNTVEDSQKWLTFALPNTITDFTLYMYDPNNNGGTWAPTQISMSKGTSTIEGYNVWEARPGQDGGATYRIVINN